MTESFPSQGFGKGLDLASKPDNVDQASCIDTLNCTFTSRGAIEQRPGYGKQTSSELTNRVESLEPFYTTSGTKQLLAGCGTRLEAIEATGAVKASKTGLTAAVWDFARFGQPNEEVAYAGNGTNTLLKWSGTAWSEPKATVDGVTEKAMPKAGALCLTPTDNRLACSKFSTTTGGPNGGISSPSHVYFSEAGNPESFESTAYIQFTPGDGEKIQAVIAWKEFVFVFKETKFFVVTGTATTAAGKPEFLYRPIEAGVGLASPRAVCIHPTGVYFMGRAGIYRTTGQEPELLSSDINPIWIGEPSSFFTGGILAQASITNCAMGVWQDRIYVAYPNTELNNRVLVYDPRLEWWSLYNLPASCLASFRVSNEEEMVFGYATGTKDIGRHSKTYTADGTTAIESYWRSGWFDLESPDIKVIRSSKFWGTGKVFQALGHDFFQGTGTLSRLDFSDPTAPTWGGSTWGGTTWAEPRGLIQQERRTAVRGTTFSLYLYNATLEQTWSLHRSDHHLREVLKPERITA